MKYIIKSTVGIIVWASRPDQFLSAYVDGGAIVGDIDNLRGLAAEISSVPSTIPSVPRSDPLSSQLKLPTKKPSSLPSSIPTNSPSFLPSISPSVSSTIPSMILSQSLKKQQNSQFGQGSYCDDDVEFTFELDNGNIQDCAWFTWQATRSARRKERYCGRDNVAAACLSACDNCSTGPSNEPSAQPSVSIVPSDKPSLETRNSQFERGNNSNDNNNQGSNDHDFLIIIVSSSVGALVVVLGALLLVFRNHGRRNVDFKDSFQDADLAVPEKEPEPLPAPSVLKKHHSSQFNTKSRSARPAQMGMPMPFHLSYDETEGGLVSEFNPSTIRTEKISIWERRLERDTSYELESKTSGISDFMLPSIYDPSTIRSEGSVARNTKKTSVEGVTFFNEDPIPDQIFCIDEEN